MQAIMLLDVQIREFLSSVTVHRSFGTLSAKTPWKHHPLVLSS